MCIYFSIIVSRVLYSTSPVYSEAMGSTGSKNRCSLCPRQLSTAIVHRATQKGVSEERGDCHTPTRQRGRKVNTREGASWVKYLHQESLHELHSSFTSSSQRPHTPVPWWCSKQSRASLQHIKLQELPLNNNNLQHHMTNRITPLHHMSLHACTRSRHLHTENCLLHAQ